jgi:hypothetical protein
MKKGYLKYFTMGYIKKIVVLILTAGVIFLPLNRIINGFSTRNSGCLLSKNKHRRRSSWNR